MDFNELEEKYYKEIERTKRLEGMLKEVLKEVSKLQDGFMQMEIEQETLSEINTQQNDELKLLRLECHKLEQLSEEHRKVTDSNFNESMVHLTKITDIESRLQNEISMGYARQTETDSLRRKVDTFEVDMREYRDTVEKVLPDCEIGSSLIGRWEVEEMIDDKHESAKKYAKKYAEEQAEEYTSSLQSEVLDQIRNSVVRSRTDLIEVPTYGKYREEVIKVGAKIWAFDDDAYYGSSQALIESEITKMPDPDKSYSSIEIKALDEDGSIYTGTVDSTDRIFIEKCKP